MALSFLWNNFFFPPSSHSYCYDFSMSQPRWQRLRSNRLFGAVFFNPPQSQTGRSARRCGRQAEIEENNVFCSPSLCVCLTLRCTKPPLLASHLKKKKHDILIMPCCFVLLDENVYFSAAVLNELPATLTGSTQDPIRFNIRTIILPSLLTLAFGASPTSRTVGRGGKKSDFSSIAN